MSLIEVAALLLGAIIGAGFATGAEITTFFNHLPLPTWLIAILVGAALLLVLALSIALNITPTRSTATPLNLVHLFFYTLLFTTMTAGMAQLAGRGAAIISLILSGFLVGHGVQRLAHLNTGLVLIIILSLIIICFPHSTVPSGDHDWHALPNGIWWALLYAGLNCFMLPELITAILSKVTKRVLYGAAILTAGIVASGVYLILTAIRVTATATNALPLLTIAPTPCTFIIILLAIFTSQYAALFAIVQKAQRLSICPKTPIYGWCIIFCCLAFGGSFWGFSQILTFGYPLIGAFTCGSLLFSWFWRFWRRTPLVPSRSQPPLPTPTSPPHP